MASPCGSITFAVHLITSGELRRLVAEDGVSGVTSNPSIFEKALTGSSDYNDFLAAAARRQERDAMSLYEDFAVADVQQAADVLRQVYDQTQRRDGYVSLEVSPAWPMTLKAPSAKPAASGIRSGGKT